MVRTITVIGGGSAGFMAALALKMKIPSLRVRVVRSKDIGVIGVGEGSGVPFTRFLHEYLRLNLTRFLHEYLRLNLARFVREAAPSWKLGTRFLWGPRESFFFPFGPHLNQRPPELPRPAGFYCGHDAAAMDCASPTAAFMAHNRLFPRGPNGSIAMHGQLAYHIENETFARYLESVATTVGVEILDDTIRQVLRDEQGVTALMLASGRTESADLYVDCSGFTSLLLGKTLGEPFVSYKSSLFCDRAVVGGWDRGDEPIRPYTTAETMAAGWSWQIEHRHRINRGYVYCSEFITDEAAELEFRAANPKVGPTRIVKFVSGRYERSWVGNVVAIGNASGFVEPLEATALAVIATRAELLTDILIHADLNPATVQVRLFNENTARTWDSIRRFLAVHYKFNHRLETPFWRHAQQQTDLAGADDIVECYRQIGPRGYWERMTVDSCDVWGIEGYLSMLVGQRVPHRPAPPPTDREWAAWESYRRQNRDTALRALTVEQVFDHLDRHGRPSPSPTDPARAPAPAMA